MKFARFLLPIVFIFITSCADDRKVEVPVNSSALSNSSDNKTVAAAAPVPTEVPAPASTPAPAATETPAFIPVIIERQERVVPIQRFVIIRSHQQIENIEYTSDLYISPEAQPFVRSTQLQPRPIDVLPNPQPAAEQTEPKPATEQIKLKPLAAKPGAQRSRVTFLASIIYHKDGQADISVKDKAAISEVADFVLEKDGRVRVYGHASTATRGLKPEAAKKANFEVSKQRALAVRRELIASKVPAEHIRAFAASDRRPAVPETDPKAEAINRRTEIFVRF